MLKRIVVAFSSAIALAAVAAPVFADNSIGFDPDYVLNPNGKEVEQTYKLPYFGFDYARGSYQPAARPSADEKEQHARSPRTEPGHAYSDPSFGAQADA